MQSPQNLKPIDENSLIALAGKAAFSRGENYHLEGRVGELQHRGNKIIAIVSGNEEYQVTLSHTAKVFEGACDCPASEGFDFCKHCVATALEYLQQTNSLEKLQASGEENLLANYLHSLDKDILADELLALIEMDSVLEEKWALKAQVAAGKMNSKSFRKRITRAIPYNRHLYRYAQVRQYFARVESLVDAMQPLLVDFAPAQSLDLIDYALSRIERALETVDDSGGFRYYSVEELGEMHLRMLAECKWPLQKSADYLRKLYVAGDNDLYPAIPGDYLPILGQTGLELFNAPLRVEWDSLPAPGRDGVRDWEVLYRYQRLQAPLLLAARLDSDLDSEIALLAKTAVESGHLIKLSALCLQHDRLEQAIEWWRRARDYAQEDRGFVPDSALVEMEIDILCYQQKYAQALQKRWSAFQDAPSVRRYRELLDMARLAGDERDFYQLTLEFLAPIVQENGRITHNLLCELHIEAQNPQQALEIALKHSLQPEILLEVIRANPQQPAKVLLLYIRLAEFYIRKTDNKGYREAIRLLKEANHVAGKTLRSNLNEEVKRLGLQFKAKRNFRKWLEEAFPELFC